MDHVGAKAPAKLFRMLCLFLAAERPMSSVAYLLSICHKWTISCSGNVSTLRFFINGSTPSIEAGLAGKLEPDGTKDAGQGVP